MRRGALQQGAGNIEAAALAMGELPASFTDHLQQPGGHAVEERPQIRGRGTGPPPAARSAGWAGQRRPISRLKAKVPAKDVVVVELWRGHHPPPPARGAQGLAVQPPEEQEAGVRLAQPGEERRQGGFSAPRWSFQQQALPGWM